jgi:hypothetical protein
MKYLNVFYGGLMRTATFVLLMLTVLMPKTVNASVWNNYNLPEMIERSRTIVYGKLSLNSNIEKNRRSDDTDVVDFFVKKSFMGGEKNVLIPLCDFSWGANIRKGSKNGYYILFLNKDHWNDCYVPVDRTAWIMEVTRGGKIINTKSMLDEPAHQSMQKFIGKLKTGVKKQHESWENARTEMRKQREEEKALRIKSNKENMPREATAFAPKTIAMKWENPSLSEMIENSDFIAYGRLSLDSNIKWGKRVDDQDVVDFFVVSVLKGDEKNILVGLCDFPIDPESYLNWNFRGSKEGYYIFFLRRIPLDTCYEAREKVEIIAGGKEVDTSFIKNELTSYSLQEFLKKIKMEVRKKKEKTD